MGVPNHFTERWWGMKIFSIFKMEYEIFLDYLKLSSDLVPRIKNDHSLIPESMTSRSRDVTSVYFKGMSEVCRAKNFCDLSYFFSNSSSSKGEVA